MKDDIIHIVKDTIHFFLMGVLLNSIILLNRLGIIKKVDFDQRRKNNIAYIKKYSLNIFIQGVVVGVMINSVFILIIIGTIFLTKILN